MLGSTRLDSSLIFLLNWFVVVVGLTLLGLIITTGSRRWSIAGRHCVTLTLLMTFLVAPIALFLASQCGIGHLDWTFPAQTGEVENAHVETSDHRQPTVEEEPATHRVVMETERASDDVSFIDATIAGDASKAIVTVSRPTLVLWFSIGRLSLLLAGTVWLIGSLICFFSLIRKLRSLFGFLKRLDSVQDPSLNLLAQQSQQRFGLPGKVSMFQSSSISVPISTGILRSVIVVPEFFTSQLTQAQQRAVLLHEMAHLDRRDSYIGLFQEVCYIVYWWHPWILRHSKELDTLREHLCDQRVVEIEGDGRTLAEALLQVAQCAVEPRLRLPCLSSMVDEIGDIAQRLQVLCNLTQLNLQPLSAMKRNGILFVAVLCVLGTAIPTLRGQPAANENETIVAGDEKNDAKKNDAQQVQLRSDEDWIAILVAAKSHNPVAFHFGPQIVALDRSRSLSIVERSWPQIQIGEVKNGILKAFQSSENPDILTVLHLGMTDANPAVQDYARDYLCYWALQKFERSSSDYAIWYAAHREQSLKDVLLDGYRDIAQMCDKLPATEAIQKLQQLEQTIDGKWKSAGSEVRKTALKESGIGDFPIQWIRSNTLDQDQMAYACKLLRQIPGRPLESADVLRSWMDVKHSLILRASAAIALAELDRDAAIDAMLLMIEEITRDEDYDKAGGTRMRDELCWKLSELGEPRAIPELIAIMDCDNSRETIGTIDGALTMFRLGEEWVREGLRPMRDGQWWRRWWEKNRQRMPEPLQQVAIRDIPKTKFGKDYVPFPADMDTYEGLKAYLQQELKKESAGYTGLGYLFSMQQDLRGIPILIGAIDSDNSYETIYGLGYYGLGFLKGVNLTGVEYSPYHDGAWWRRWWEANKHRFPPEVQAIPIPDYPKSAHGKSYRPFPANMDTFEGRVDYLRRELAIAGSQLDVAAEALSYPDPRTIATLIGVWAACDEAQMKEEGHAFVRPLYNVIAKEKQFDMQAIVDAEWTAAWWRDWYQVNRSKIQGLENFDLPDFRVELSDRAGK